MDVPENSSRRKTWCIYIERNANRNFRVARERGIWGAKGNKGITITDLQGNINRIGANLHNQKNTFSLQMGFP